MLKRKLFGVLSVTFLSLSIIATPYRPSANNEEQWKTKISNETQKYGGSKGTIGVIDNLTDESSDSRNNRSTFSHLLSRIIIPNYMNYAPDGHLGEGLVDPRDSTGNLCSRDSSQSVTSHNCDVPNISGEIFGGLTGLLGKKGIVNGERTSSRADYGLGIPQIPTKAVPTDPNNRIIKYTGLELFGYSLPVTDYYGEVDEISVSSAARALSNFGVMDNVVLTGKKILGGLGGLFGGIEKSFQSGELNPMKWIFNAFEGSVSGGWNVAIDTEELNVIASHGWTRPEFGKTIYNAGVISDKEILENNIEQVYTAIAAHLKDVISKDTKLQEYLSLVEVPKWELKEIKTKKSEKELKDYEEKLKKWEKDGVGEEPKPPVIEFVPAKDQFANWIKENKKKFDKTKDLGFSCTDQPDYATFSTCWRDGWTGGIKTFEDKAKEIADTFRNSFLLTFLQPENNPTHALSHYVCLNEDGSYKRDANGKYVRVFSNPTSPDGEVFNNPNCSITVRPTIKGSYFSSEFGPTASDDGRYIQWKKRFNPLGGILPDMGKDIGNIISGFTRFSTQITNALVGLAYGDLLQKLKIDTIIEKMVISLRDSIFFPLSSLVVALTALYTLFKVLMSGNLKNALMTFGLMILVSLLGAILFYQPKNVVNFAQKGPDAIDTLILNTIYSSSGSNLCTSSGSTQTNSLRSIQCEIWNVNIFSPWLERQFGTSYKNLEDSEVLNKNKDLVGNASVNMGAGIITNNWALYQLSLTKSGTITTDDYVKIPGKTDPNMYRLVDLQFGPNNNVLSDTRYSSTWSGIGRTNVSIAFWGVLVAGMVLYVVGGLALDKLKFSLIMLFIILYMPLAFLVALLPGQQGKFKEYWTNLLSIFIKRIMVTIFLTVLLTTLSIILQNSTMGYMENSLFVVLILFLFAKYKTEFYEKLGITGSGGFSPQQISNFISKTIPDEIEFRAKKAKERFDGTIAGGIGGFVAAWRHLDTDGNKGLLARNWEKFQRAGAHARVGAARGARRLGGLEERKQRKKGFAIGQIMEKGYNAAKVHGAKSIMEGKGADSIARDVYRESDSHREYSDESQIKNSLTQEHAAILNNANLQKLLRTHSKLLQEYHEEKGKTNPDKDIEGQLNHKVELIAKQIDKIQKHQLAKEAIFKPIQSINRRKAVAVTEKKQLAKQLTGATWSPKSQLEQLKQIKQEKGLEILTPKDLQDFKANNQYREKVDPGGGPAKYLKNSGTHKKGIRKQQIKQNIKNIFKGTLPITEEAIKGERERKIQQFHEAKQIEAKQRELDKEVFLEMEETRKNAKKSIFDE